MCSYSLHDGDDDLKDDETPSNDRQRLRTDWARFGRSFKYQPYECIKNYFGTEVRHNRSVIRAFSTVAKLNKKLPSGKNRSVHGRDIQEVENSLRLQ